MKIDNKNFNAIIVQDFKEKGGYKEWTDGGMCQRNGNHTRKNELNGNSRTEKYNIWKNNNNKGLDCLNTRLKTSEESINEFEDRNIKMFWKWRTGKTKRFRNEMIQLPMGKHLMIEHM